MVHGYHNALNSFNTIYLSLVRVMSHPIRCQAEFLNQLYQSSPDERKTLIENCNTEQIRTISLIASKIVNGQIIISPLHNLRLRHYHHILRFLTSQRISINRKRKTLLSFHEIVPLIAQYVLVIMD